MFIRCERLHEIGSGNICGGDGGVPDVPDALPSLLKDMHVCFVHAGNCIAPLFGVKFSSTM